MKKRKKQIRGWKYFGKKSLFLFEGSSYYFIHVFIVQVVHIAQYFQIEMERTFCLVQGMATKQYMPISYSDQWAYNQNQIKIPGPQGDASYIIYGK